MTNIGAGYGPAGGGFLHDFLRPYTGSGWFDPLYQCPGFRSPNIGGKLASSFLASTFPDGAYGYNTYGWGWLAGNATRPSQQLGLFRSYEIDKWGLPPTLRRANEVNVPSDMFALGDALICSPAWVAKYGALGGYISGRWYPFWAFVMKQSAYPMDPQLSWPSEQQAEQRRHNGLLNTVYCDGHAQAMKPAALLSTNAIAMRRWNYDHQPHQEVLARYPPIVSLNW